MCGPIKTAFGVHVAQEREIKITHTHVHMNDVCSPAVAKAVLLLSEARERMLHVQW